jgi:hypothetical protein
MDKETRSQITGINKGASKVTSDIPYLERCLTCGGSVYLDDGEPKCLMCGGDPRIKRSLSRSCGNRPFSEKIDDARVDAGALQGRKGRSKKPAR